MPTASTRSVPSLKDQTKSPRRTSLPLNRDVVVSDFSGNPSTAQVAAHFLFTRAIERELSAKRIQANSAAAAWETVIYNGGPVMEGSPPIYLIFYQPPGSLPFPSDYISGIQSFFENASGSPFAAIMTQYPDSSGVAPSGNFVIGGVFVDTTTIPPSGRTGTESDPIYDSDLQNEIAVALAANPSWPPPGLDALYEVFTSPNVWEAYSTIAPLTSFEQFCSYHAIGHDLSVNPNGSYPYVFIAYADSTEADGTPVDCGGDGPYPNGAGVDKSSNTTWHETNEAMTDPLETAWIGSDGEIADLCNFIFGNIAPNGANTALNSLPYRIQQIWSLATGACAKRFGASPDASLPASLDFGTVLTGTTTTSSLLIQNTSSASGVLDIFYPVSIRRPIRLTAYPIRLP